MDFESKVKSMSMSEIIRAMVAGLRKKHVRILMSSYGGTGERWNPETQKVETTCYGCAATNAVCEIAGVKFNTENIWPGCVRAEAVHCRPWFLTQFEDAINDLRLGCFTLYNTHAEFAGFAVFPESCMPDVQMTLEDDYTEEQLVAWEALADSLETT